MNEELNPGVQTAPDVLESPVVVEAEAEMPNYSEMSLAELSQLFEELAASEDRMKRSKEADAIKAAFYKRLSKERSATLGVEEGEAAVAEENGEPADETVVPDDVESGEQESGDSAPLNPFTALENGFKAVYARYKKERAEFNRRQEAEREENLVRKQAVIDDLKALVENQEDLGTAFPAFRELQARWRAVGPVPVQSFRNLNDTYQFYVEKFYDKVQINRDLRDLDFKKNLEAKEEFCQMAERLSENEDIVDAFKELQKLHEQWKEFGPVAKEYRDMIWDRFKAATYVINKKYQAYFEAQKEKQVENLAAKSALCEKVEAIADKEDISGSNEWNALSKAIEEIQKEWKTIGFASKKENQKIYDRFRAACDAFFAERDKHSAENSYSANLKAKKALIEEIKAYVPSEELPEAEARKAFAERWQAIGFVPFKEKDKIQAAYNEAMKARFGASARGGRQASRGGSPVRSEKDRLIAKYNKLQQDIDTYENNIGFFAMSKNSQPLIQQMQERIEAAKAELKELENQIHTLEETEE